MKNKTDPTLVSLVSSMTEETNVADLHSATVPLLANAILGNKDMTAIIMQKMLTELGLNDVLSTDFKSSQSTEIFLRYAKGHPLPFAENAPVTSWSWILGRILAASNRLDDKVTASNMAELMVDVLTAKPLPNDAFHAWTWGYLLAYYASSSLAEYEQYKHTMLDVSEAYTHNAVLDPDNLSELLWVHVMALQGPALAKDKQTSNLVLNQMISDAKLMGIVINEKAPFSAQLVQALNGIKKDDYRAWALSLVKFAFAVMGDKESHESLATPVASAIAKSHRSEDKVLAMANDFLSHLILESREMPGVHE